MLFPNLFAFLEYAGCPEFFHIVIVAVGTGLDLPRIARFAVQKIGKFVVERAGIRAECLKLILVFHEGTSL
jgi:hypothetical protein